MGINLLGPGGSSSTAYLIADSVTVPNGSKDGTAVLTKNAGTPVSAALEIQSTKGGLLLPRMTSAQRDALNAVDGMQIFNTDTISVNVQQNGVWIPASGGFTAAVTLNLGNITTMNGAAIPILGAPGAGLCILVNKLLLSYRFNTATYTGGGPVALQYGAGAYSAANAASQPIAATILTTAADTFGVASAPSATAIITISPTDTVINTGIYLSNSTANFGNNPAAGGFLFVKVAYSVVLVPR